MGAEQVARPALRLRRRTVRRVSWFAVIVLVPCILWLLVFRYYAVGYLGYLSLQRDSGTDVSGLGNYARLFTSDDLFHTAILNTIHYTVLFIAVQLPLALAIAVGINSIRNKRAREAALTAYFMPLITSTAATSVVFVFLYNPTFGLIDQVLRTIGLPNQSFLNSPDTALNSVVFMDIWKSLGFPVLIFYTGLQTIPTDFYDAAAVDGAGAWARFTHITWPLLMPTTSLMLTVQIVETLRTFTPVYVMTGTGANPPGGPINSTMIWTLDIFQQAFEYGRFSSAAAMAVLLFIFVGIFLAIQLRVTRIRWTY